MFHFFRLILVAAVFTLDLFSGMITFEVTNLGVHGTGDPLYRYTYTLEDFSLAKNTEVDLKFDPALYGVLLNPVAPAEFDVLLLQPDNPPGTFGDFSILSLVNNPSLAGPFSVDFTFLAPGTPGPQPFLINRYDDDLNFIETIERGMTAVIPEPATVALAVSGLLMAGVWRVVRRRVVPKTAAGL